jgi:hypothetical protein
MTSSEDPDSGGVCFRFFLRLGAVDLVTAWRATSGDIERGRLSGDWRDACGGDADLTFDCIIERIKNKPWRREEVARITW